MKKINVKTVGGCLALLAVAIILLTGEKNRTTERRVVGSRKRYIQLKKTNTTNS